MHKTVCSNTLFVLSWVFLNEIAASDCPLPGVTSLIYFDLEQLSSISLQQGFNEAFESPMLCEHGEHQECSKQQCCHGEIGCCHFDTRKCGCKKPGEEMCSHPTPLAIMTNTECNDDNKRKISVCVRENRGNEESYIMTNRTILQPFKDTKNNSRDIGALLIVATLLYYLKEINIPIASSECSLPPVNSLVYLDLEKLNLLALQQGYSDVIQTPEFCENGNDEDCSQQECCHEEVGCCYFNPNSKHIRKCGCKKLGDKDCTFPAPLSILVNEECQTNKKTKISGCLRERRENEENMVVSPWNTVLQPSTTEKGILPETIQDFKYYASRLILECVGNCFANRKVVLMNGTGIPFKIADHTK